MLGGQLVWASELVGLRTVNTVNRGVCNIIVHDKMLCFIIAYHNRTMGYRRLAEDLCAHGIKELHKQIMNSGVLARAFPVQSHSRAYVESWIDELEYADIPDVSKRLRVYLHNAGAMMNGRVYSVDVCPKAIDPTPLREVLEQGAVGERFLGVSRPSAQPRHRLLRL